MTDDEWAAVAVVPGELWRVVDRDGGHVQVLGEQGRGKTTCLLALVRRLRQSGARAVYEYLPAGQDRLRTKLEGLDVFLLDEAQRLGSGGRRQLLRGAHRADRGTRLVVATHQDLTPLFTRHELALATVDLDAVTPTHVAAVLTQRLAPYRTA